MLRRGFRTSATLGSTLQIVRSLASTSRSVTRYSTNRAASLAVTGAGAQTRLHRARYGRIRLPVWSQPALLRHHTRLPAFIRKQVVFEFVVDENPPIAQKLSALQQLIKQAKKIEEIDKLTSEQVETTKDHIREHAYRHVEYYFHLLIAVWKQHINIESAAGAKLQHGQGSSALGTAGCHSTPYSNLNFKPTSIFYRWFGVQDRTLSGTHFEDQLNGTMELPTVVNQFDQQFEGGKGNSRWVQEGLAILNKCSRGELSPVDGLNAYLAVRTDFFATFEAKSGKESTLKLPNAMRLACQYQRDGTSAVCKPETNEVSHAFVALALGTSTHAVRLGRLTPVVLGRHYRRMQGEIFGSKAPAKTMAPTEPRL